MKSSPQTSSPLAVLGGIATVALVAAAFAAAQIYRRDDVAWWLLGAALVLSVVWQRRIDIDGPVLQGPSGPSTWPRRVLGAALALVGCGLWYRGSSSLLLNWRAGFDQAWICWFAGTVLLGGGLDLLWARWRPPPGGARRRIAMVLVGVIGLAALYRLGTFYFFPSPYYVTQVEELQVGAMGMDALAGNRIRWEYLSQAWLGALGLWLGGPTLLATRLPSTVVSILKVAPFFLWMRFTVGNTGAIVAAVLLAVSGWDTTFARVSTNHNVFVVACVFALLAGPARRGRPSAYVWLGLFSGYVLFEYVLYRPLALFALVGAVMTSLRDQHARWPARLVRPLLTAALFLAMTWPLYLYITGTGRTREFFDGYGRARSNQVYYNAEDSWQVALQKRWERTRMATGMFFFHGPDSPVANPKAVPLTDPFTAGLIVIGTGYALAHPWRRLFGLTLAASLVTFGGAMVVTGNFDFVRAGSAVGYVFALAGFGAAGIAAALRGLGPTRGRRLTAALMIAGIALSVHFNTSYLWDFVTSPEIRRAQFRDLAYLSWWIAEHVGENERAVVVAPNFPYLMESHDAAWMRGPRKEGKAVWDLQSGLREWVAHPDTRIFMIYGGAASSELQSYLAWLLPGVSLTLDAGPIGPDKDLLYARVQAPPPEVERQLARWVCQPVKIRVELVGEDDKILETVYGSAGLVDPTQWPGTVQLAAERQRALVRKARVHISGSFEVKQEGEYVFPYVIYPGTGSLSVDGKLVPYPPTTAVLLSAGQHHVELLSEYDPNASAPVHGLYWLGPDSGGKRELLPFYRLAPESCTEPTQAG